MKHILFLTDFSENAKNAIYYGLSMFRDEPCKFHFLNTVPIIYDSSGFPIAIHDVISENVKKSFKSLLEQINKDFKKNKFNTETIFKIGELVPITSSIVTKKKIDLIIMGTKGASGISEVLIGSQTSSVIMHVNCPILAIPEKSKFKLLSKIVLALDREMVTSKKVLKPFLEIANMGNPEVLILHIVNKHEEEKLINRKKTNKLLKEINHSYHIIYDEDISHGIETFVKEKKANMLSMINYELKFFEKIFHKSTTKKISFHLRVPLLVMHDKK